VQQFYVKFGDPSCISFCDIMQKNRQTDHTKTNAAEYPTHVTTVGMNNDRQPQLQCNYGCHLLTVMYLSNAYFVDC